MPPFAIGPGATQPHLSRFRCSLEAFLVALLLAASGFFLAYSATRHSPTQLEPAFLASGVSHWELGRFDLYRVNPPLPRMIAAIPVVVAGYKSDWSRYYDAPGARAEFLLGEDFLLANGVRSMDLIVLARWACIPFTLIGAYFAYRWSKGLYGGAAGLLTLLLYLLEPNLISHGELITPDAACVAFNIMAGYAFWRWIQSPAWSTALLAGIALGAAELTKTSLLILFLLWPTLWGFRHLSRFAPCMVPGDAPAADSVDKTKKTRAFLMECPQLMAILATGVVVINCGYGFDGFGTPVAEFEFVSTALKGETSSSSGNRFAKSLYARLPTPLPKQYVLGIDGQKKDLEAYTQQSYLRGEWRAGGWWYYYLYGLLVKCPCGSILLLVCTMLVPSTLIRLTSISDELMLVSSACALLIVLSCHLEFNIHFRYALPCVGIAQIFLGRAAVLLKYPVSSAIVMFCVLFSLSSSICAYPHHLSYFNEFVGGSKNGYRHLLGSSFDWGQDWICVADWFDARPNFGIDWAGSCLHRPPPSQQTMPQLWRHAHTERSEGAAEYSVRIVTREAIERGMYNNVSDTGLQVPLGVFLLIVENKRKPS